MEEKKETKIEEGEKEVERRNVFERQQVKSGYRYNVSREYFTHNST